MGIMDRILRRGSGSAATAEPTIEVECPHTTLTPRWDSVEDMGKTDRVTLYRCEGCRREFTPEEARQFGAGA
jgi:hypothetical protein